jgi:hypothetical protein
LKAGLSLIQLFTICREIFPVVDKGRPYACRYEAEILLFVVKNSKAWFPSPAKCTPDRRNRNWFRRSHKIATTHLHMYVGTRVLSTAHGKRAWDLSDKFVGQFVEQICRTN